MGSQYVELMMPSRRASKRPSHPRMRCLVPERCHDIDSGSDRAEARLHHALTL